MRKSHQNWIISLGHNKRVFMSICETKVADGRDCMEGKMYWFLLCCICMGKYPDCEKVSVLRFWLFYTFSTPLNLKEWFSKFCLPVFMCICVWMCASPVPEELKGFYSYSVFGSSSIYYMNMIILAQKIWALKMGPRKQNGDFLRLNFSIHGDHIHK
jgi:hypothetical protein